MRLLPVLVVCLLFVGAGLLADDIVHTKDGKSYRGKIVSRDGKLVRLKTPYGELRIPTSDITAIERELERLKVGMLARYGAKTFSRSFLTRKFAFLTRKFTFFTRKFMFLART